MRGPFPRALLVLCLTAALVLTASLKSSYAFYEWHKDQKTLEVRGLVRGFGIAAKNPEDDFFYEDKRDADLGVLGRLLMDGSVGERFGFEFNAFQAYIPASQVSSQTALDTPLDVERSAALEWSFSNDEYLRLAVDRLNARWSLGRLDLTLGRQPINLATTFFFTPNDFFAPFAAQTYFRIYKSGVDAARAEVRLGDLSQLSLISVLGYKQDVDSDTGWSDNPEGNRTSFVGRASTVLMDFEWTLLGGTVRDRSVIGGAIQGELFQWLGIRAEGHYANPDQRGLDSVSEISLGLEHRWENSLNLRMEQFRHGRGAASVKDYSLITLSSESEVVYLARDYTAMGLDYEFTPLLTGGMSAIVNWTDDSYLISLNAVYSLSDEAELAVSVGLPFGHKPDGPQVKSEFGLYPASLILEVRSYF